MADKSCIKDIEVLVQNVNILNLRRRWKNLQAVDFESLLNAQPKLPIGQDNWDLITSREIIEGLHWQKQNWIGFFNLQQFVERIDDFFFI